MVAKDQTKQTAIPDFMPGIQPSTGAEASGPVDPGDKHRETVSRWGGMGPMLAPSRSEHEQAFAQPEIDVDGLTVVYPNGHTALADVSFTLGPGTICGLAGPNGSGKSTLFKALMGFVRPARGKVQICGLSVREALKRRV